MLEATSLNCFILWSLVWIVVLNIPPGSKEIMTAYRLNFVHGLLSSVMAIIGLFDVLPEPLVTMTTISYFFVDFVNIMLNDFVFKVKSYQPPTARKVEYLHHILCFTVGMSSELTYKKYCTFKTNPFIKLMFAELSTPLLMAWRVYPENDLYGYGFAVLFFFARILYHGFIYVPDCIRSCNKTIAYSFGVPYNLLNVFFMYMIVQKLMRNAKKDKKKRGKKDE